MLSSPSVYRSQLIVLVCLGLCPVLSRADPQALQSCLQACGPQDLPCLLREADCLLGSGLTHDALERLKTALSSHPESQAAHRALARAYLADDNPLWAQKILQQALELRPEDCESRSWLAWIFISQGLMEQAAEVLDRPGCPTTAPEHGRFQLLRSYQRMVESGQPPLGESLEAIGRGGVLFPEDRALWRELYQKARPGWLDPISLRLDTGVGYTTNAKAGGPEDPDSPGAASALGMLDWNLRALWPFDSGFRPMLEASAAGYGLSADAAASAGFWEFAGKPAVVLGRGVLRWTVGYRLDHLLLGQGNYASYYTGHRGEVEVEGRDWSVFVGLGRRLFKQSWRTRTEFDVGGGKIFGPFCRYRLTLGGTARSQWADHEAYSVVGATLLVSLRIDLAAGTYGQLGFSGALDHYPGSGGKRGYIEFGTIDKRLDLTGKASAALWSPAVLGVRFSAGADVSWRDSSADTKSRDFDYQELRFLVRARWNFDWNPGMPAAVRTAGHVPLEYGPGTDGSGPAEGQRILDLLRQDEADRRGACGCAK